MTTHQLADTHTSNDRAITQKIYFNECLIVALVFSLVCHGFGVIGLFVSSSIFGRITDLFLVAVSVVGVVPVVVSAVQALWKKIITVDLLASIALVVTLLHHDWISAVFINLMLSSARLFSAFTERRTENIISHLLKLRPTIVKVQVHDHFVETQLVDVHVGDIVVIESGDRIPIDGVVVEGQASIDQSTLTGESEPVTKTIGNDVSSSTLCVSGSLFVRATRVGEDTTLSKMIKMVDEASRAKTKTETLANRFSAWYISLSLIGAVSIYLVTHNVALVLSILLVTCADDLAVAIPLGFTVAIAKAAKHGIVVKGAAVMERVKTIIYFLTDKTGTLTKGTPVISLVISAHGYSHNDCVRAGLVCALGSKHPTSNAIIAYAKKEHITSHAPDKVQEFPGEGIIAHHDEQEYYFGRISFLEHHGVYFSEDVMEQIAQAQQSGNSVSAISLHKKLVGLFIYADEIRPYAGMSIAETKMLGVKKWIMLTGDNPYVAEKVAQTVGIDEYHANLKPEDKLEYIKTMKQSHSGSIAMIGDGVNDAASLALADVSFAMGAIGSDISVEAADIALMHDDLRRVPEAIYLSKEVLIIVKQNFGIWAVTNTLGLALVFMGYLNPVGASVFNFLTDFVPILNVFRIYNLKINKHTYDKI